ncbi:hypothetical protein GLOIN_2v1765605 [Rhizophagus clarus]|uniref:RRM domain-containing protein n=1 Tax=Rhizophagus clarus TaxID=94130 RepID=A0A8H3M3S9_9GLOM|nr:hypothetical protein GLOIN_2v1765605 [Rhizophagus clarus]
MYVNNEIPDDKKHHVRDIFIYNIPISWSQEKIIAELQAWDDVISMTIKKQQKYQILRLKICLFFFILGSFDSNIWQYSLGSQAQLWNHTKPSKLFTNYIKSLKHFNITKGSHIVAYFKKYQDVEEYRKTPFTFNHNEVNTTLDWSYSPATDKPKKSKNSDKTSTKVLPKTHEKTSKPEKNLKKTSKKSKKKNKKKKKKSSDKKRNKNMDLIKLLLQFLN